MRCTWPSASTSRGDAVSLRIAALLHDVGKIGVPDDILRKPGRLTPYEFEIVKQHVALGDLIVRDVPTSTTFGPAVRYHHERWDGGGYMAGLPARTSRSSPASSRSRMPSRR